MKGVEIYNFIKPHLGRINATGSHGVDMERLENFKVYEELMYCLFEDIEGAHYNSLMGKEGSVKQINAVAGNLMMDYHIWLTNTLGLN